MTLFHQCFRVRNVHSIWIWKHFIRASSLNQWNHLFPMLQPSPDDHVLSAGFHSRHLKNLLWSVMHPLILFKAPQSQQYYSAMFIQCEVSAILYFPDDGLFFWFKFDDLSSIQICQLLSDFISSLMLLSCHSLLKIVMIHLDLNFIRNFIALSLLWVTYDCWFHGNKYVCEKLIIDNWWIIVKDRCFIFRLRSKISETIN